MYRDFEWNRALLCGETKEGWLTTFYNCESNFANGRGIDDNSVVGELNIAELVASFFWKLFESLLVCTDVADFLIYGVDVESNFSGFTFIDSHASI